MIKDNGDGTLTRTGLPAAAVQTIDALRDPGYGVPTGVVPHHYTAADVKHDYAAGVARVVGDPIQQAVDDYLLMERKARAWDAAVASLSKHIGPATPVDMALLDLIKEAVQTAQTDAPPA